jgi:quercetin dioxygenase-like cupin family protein
MPDEQHGWKVYPGFRGLTANLSSISCHASVLLQGHMPHPPHGHVEEQLLLLLDGEVALVLAGNERTALRPGEFVYYPANFTHTLKTTSAKPATYVVFKWRGEQAGGDSPLSYRRFDTTGSSRMPLLFDEPTQHLRKLQSHVTILEPGGGYEPHVDAYDVAIVVLEGELETIDGRAKPHDVIFFLAAEAHGMRNVGDTVARYVVFEFHGRTSLVRDAPSAAKVLLTKVRDRQRLKRKLAKLLGR